MNGNFDIRYDKYFEHTKILYQNRYLLLQELDIYIVNKFSIDAINSSHNDEQLKNFVNLTYTKTYKRLNAMISYFNGYNGTVHTSDISVYNTKLNNPPNI